jgi:hypothetical protein
VYEVQEKLVGTISKLKDAHKLQLQINKLEQVVHGTMDGLPDVVGELAGGDEFFVSAAAQSVASRVDLTAVPTSTQLAQDFRSIYARCRFQTLLPGDAPYDYALATIANYVIPSNIRSIDGADTLQKVRLAQSYLAGGRLEKCLAQLEGMEGAAKAEV